MYVDNKVALHLTFLILAINTDLAFIYITLVISTASKKKLDFFFLMISNGNRVSYMELLLSATTFICNIYLILKHFLFLPQCKYCNIIKCNDGSCSGLK